MKCVFISNYYNHHQSEFAEEMYRKCNRDFHFIMTTDIPEARKKMGYLSENFPSFVINLFSQPEKRAVAQELINTAEVVIIGNAPDCFVIDRLKSGGLTFRCQERIYKQKPSAFRLIKSYFKHIKKNRRFKNLYLLCCSAYTYPDYLKTHTFVGKAYKWGYFPAVKNYDDIEKLIGQKKSNSLLWVARFLEWKHPEIPLYVAQRLKQDGYDFELKMIGRGELEENIQKAIIENGLQDCVHLMGTMTPAEVRENMEQAEMFLFTSDRNEGWGAVLNESMNSACAVVANEEIGSVPYLLKDGENGFIYRGGNLEDFYGKVKYLFDHPQERMELSRKAYQTIQTVWNAKVASERFLALAESLLDNTSSVDFREGPCSNAAYRK